MTETLGDQIRARRAQYRELADAARQAACDWAKGYTDNAHDLITTYVQNQISAALTTAGNYVDNQIAAAKTYVDNQITAAKTVGKNYTDQQITKLKADNNLI